MIHMNYACTSHITTCKNDILKIVFITRITTVDMALLAILTL